MTCVSGPFKPGSTDAPRQGAEAELTSHYIPRITTTPSAALCDSSPQTRHCFWSTHNFFLGQESTVELRWIDPTLQEKQLDVVDREEAGFQS